jgi:tetratricopeptide (TPR) repeat protein
LKGAWLVIVLCASFGTARADQAEPWVVGVSADTQARANALFAEANALFAQQAHAPALEKYRAAIALWDHPLIRFNLAVTLIRLDRVLEAADELDRALRYGAAPFSKELYDQALDYQGLLKGRVGDLEIACAQAGAHVELDGKAWFDCPGTKRQRVLAGEHAVVTERPGYLTSSERVVVPGGSRAHRDIKLVPLDSAVVLKYRFARWVPWTVGVAGLAIAGTGLAVYLSGKSQLDQFYGDLATTCPTGCKLSDEPLLANEKSSALFKGKLGDGLMIGGGVVALVGVALVLYDRPQRIVPNVEVQPAAGGAVASFSGRF